ncbi:MAG: hypothetical protein RL685_6150, partial [Pseudomonadota bacterium]
MATSPLEHDELRHIERTLDAGDTAGAAQLLARLANSRAHEVAITFLATRLLFQRGRIDMAGAADRVSALLSRSGPFLEAEDWLAELEGRTEPNVLPEAPAVLAEAPATVEVLAEADLEVEGDEQTSPSHPPPSRAPSVPRPSHPYFDQLGDDEDEEVTPAEPLASRRQESALDDAIRAQAMRREATRREGGHPPARADEDGSEPPPRPVAAIASAPPPGLEPTSPAFPAARSKASTPPGRHSYKPFDNLRAKEQLST